MFSLSIGLVHADAAQQTVDSALLKWNEIQKLSERTDTTLRQDLQLAFWSDSATCEFYEQWFDTWNTIVDQEATIHHQANKLLDDLLVARIGVRQADLRENMNLIIIALDDQIKETQDMAFAVKKERDLLQSEKEFHCSGLSRAELEAQRHERMLQEFMQKEIERIQRKSSRNN